MTRATSAVARKAAHKKVLAQVKGARGAQSKRYRSALQRRDKNLQYSYRDRKNRKRDFRALWIQRINAGSRPLGLNYSQLIHGLALANITVNRKMLADLALFNQDAFAELVAQAKDALATKKA